MRQVNLLPDETRKTETLRFMRNSLLILLAPVFGLWFLMNLLLNIQIGALKRTAAQPLAFQETGETQALKTKIANLEKKIQEYGDQNKGIIETFVKKVPCGYLLKNIGCLSEDKVWVNAISFDTQKKECRIDGKSFSTRLVSEFMLELKRLPHFEGVDLVSVGKETRKTTQEVDFQIIGILK